MLNFCNLFKRNCCPPAACADFTAVKLDRITGRPVSGAVFTIYRNGLAISNVTSDASGRLNIESLPEGEYLIVETHFPDGYEYEASPHYIIVDACGNTSIDGQPADGYRFYNMPSADSESTDFTFLKFDSETGEALSGAVFTLSGNATAVSGQNGQVSFEDLAPGAYTLTEVTAPDGYSLPSVSYTVVVDENGNVTIDGVPASEFRAGNTKSLPESERPVIISVTAGDRIVTGTGIPGASITVTLPNGTQISTTVGSDGDWAVSVPDNITLNAGDTIYASQTVPGYGPSENASFLVQPPQR